MSENFRFDTYKGYLLAVIVLGLVILLFFKIALLSASLALNLFCLLSALQLTHPQWSKYYAICVFIAFCFAYTGCQTK